MKCVVLVGPPGSGKTTFAKSYETEDLPHSMGYVRISQDDQGKGGHMEAFNEAIEAKLPVIIDRMNFSKEQRQRYLKVAKDAGYETVIIVIHEPYSMCLVRCVTREDHPTIRNADDATSALNTFFRFYERPTDDEAFQVIRKYNTEFIKPKAIICDLDGTLCNVEHRRHFVRREGKKDWKSFFEGLKDDTMNGWCHGILDRFFDTANIVLCSGRGNEYRQMTETWLYDHSVMFDHLFMRMEKDHRQDSIVKEILLDFEILTRYTPLFAIDDRDQVVKMWRSRGITCLQCDFGDF